MKHKTSFGKIIAGIFLFAWSTPAGMIVSDLLVYELTDPQVADQIANWERSDVLKITGKGLGWEGAKNSSYDLQLMLQPFAIGHGWRPAGNAAVIVELNFEEAVGNYFGVYVRFSSNGEKWSTWLPAPQQLTEKEETEQHPFQFRAQLSVPNRESKRYREKQQEYWKLDVPWQSDEHALCEWIAKNDPEFFEENLPFAGFVQVYVEGSLHGGCHLKSVGVNHMSATSGLHQPPKDPESSKAREGAWNYWTVKKEDKSPVCGFHTLFDPTVSVR